MRTNHIYLTMAAIAAAWLLWNYQVSIILVNKLLNILMPFIIGCSMAFIINILMEKTEKLFAVVFPYDNKILAKIKRPAALCLSLITIFLVLALTVFLVVPELHNSIKTIVKAIPPAMSELNVYLQRKFMSLNLSQDDLAYINSQWQEIYSYCITFLKNNKGLLLSNTLNIASSFVYMTADLVIGFVVAVYVLLEKEFLAANIKKMLFAFCRKDNAEYILEAAAVSKRIFTGFVSGQVAEAVILGLLCFIGMLLTGLPYALVISVLVAVMALIPVLGTFISAAVGCVLTLVAAPEKIWWFIIFFFVLQRIEGDILYPKIVGKAVGLSELLVLAAITIGGSIGGIIGIIISVPVCSVICYLVSQKVDRVLKQKNIRDI